MLRTAIEQFVLEQMSLIYLCVLKPNGVGYYTPGLYGIHVNAHIHTHSVATRPQ
jgi:hypothetical protein